MSIVNLANACSHLQNASRARLGMTSLPFTKLSLSVAVILQREGFISQIKLAGRTPPLSSFAPSIREELRQRTKPAPADVEHLSRKGLITSSGEDILTDAEVEFLLAHYRKSASEIQEMLSPLAMPLPLDLGPVALQPKPSKDEPEQDIQRYVYLVDRHRRLVSEAQRLLLGRRDNPTALRDLVTPILQPENAPPPVRSTPKPAESDPDEEGVVTQANRASRRLWLGLKYNDNQPVLRKASTVSTPKKRIDLGIREIAHLVRGRRVPLVEPMRDIGEIMIFRTSCGILEARECLEKHVGGWALCRMS